MVEELKKLETHEASAKLVEEIFVEVYTLIYKKLEGIDRTQAWLILGRVINRMMARHYGIALMVTEEKLANTEKPQAAEPGRKG